MGMEEAKEIIQRLMRGMTKSLSVMILVVLAQTLFLLWQSRPWRITRWTRIMLILVSFGGWFLSYLWVR